MKVTTRSLHSRLNKMLKQNKPPPSVAWDSLIGGDWNTFYQSLPEKTRTEFERDFDPDDPAGAKFIEAEIAAPFTNSGERP